MNIFFIKRYGTFIFLIICTIGLYFNPSKIYGKGTGSIFGPWELEQFISGNKTPPKDLQILFKGASVAPEGSSWLNYLDEVQVLLDKELSGLLKVKFYAGGVLGDEADTIRKMRMKQLHLLGVTNMGLTKMIPELCVFELPFLFDWEPELFYTGKRTQVDYIIEKLEPTISKYAGLHGYQLGGLLETCFDAFGSKIKLQKADDLKKMQFWIFRGDRIRGEIAAAYGLKTTPMELYDVAQALSTGMIDSTMVGWYVSIVLQWWPHINYVTDYPLWGYESATILFDGKMFDQIIPFLDKWGHLYGIKNGAAYFNKAMEIFDNACTELRFIVRADDGRARKRMIQEGIEEIKFPEPELQKLREKILPLYDKLAGKKYPRELLDEILKYREEYRTLKKQNKLGNDWFEKGIMPDGDQRDEWRLY